MCAAENALFAGFDGVELHSQRILTGRILSPISNIRTDEYGSVETDADL
jgi:N-ethylmaleimide reductase